MGKRKKTSQFIAEAMNIHGNTYDYSKVEYIDTHTHICVICPLHGEFLTIPCDHLHGHGCPHCARERKKSLVYGIGCNDLLYTRGTPSYSAWTSMLERCYSEKYHDKKPTYKGCVVCKEWLTFSSFKEWFDSQENGFKEGYVLDKDIIVKGNKLYSPQTCCIIPPELNSLITNRKNHRGKFPVGVHRVKSGRYQARLGAKRLNIGVFNTPEEAFNAYKNAKERYIREIAEKYFKEGKITKKVYLALIEYKVEITD